ncbi:MAG: L,D-transpeptidase [Acidobacteria bacterium]|nr:L,D-transpeptidase [Acidobacteriota bacterium]
MRIMLAVFMLVLGLSAAGCVSQPVNTANGNINSNNASTTPSPNASPVKVSAADEAAMPVTMPVLDAFFADESFQAELKTKLQLTDEQINKVRATAREETAKLRETEKDDYSGTTTAARARATEQLSAIIGPEKTQQLAALVRERWSGTNGTTAGDGSASDKGSPPSSGTETAHASGSKANAVPTDTRIVVNAPAYRMDVFEGGQLVKSYKIGIGYPEFPLPTGLRRASTIIFNPTWTPPDEPWVETSNKVKAGQTVEAGSRLNPLGLLKIPIGLPSLIHGGKALAKLGTFASHGCVGLTDQQAQEFAKLLARTGGAELSDEQIAEYAKNRSETKEVKLSRPVPVELRYETIVVEDGKLHIYRDVYDRDTNTEENLRRVLEAYGVSIDQLSEQERAKVMDALKQMSRDATGKLDEPTPSASPNAAATSRNGNSGTANKNENKNTTAAARGNQVTRTVKGQKEIVVEIAALKGKGYPAPAELNTGSGATQKPSTPPPPASKRR